MAKKVSVETIDDLDGTSPAETTLVYTFDGATYEIDLSNANADKMRADLAVWIDHSRAVKGPTRRGTKLNTSNEDLSAIRTWAQSQGITVSMRGRVAANIITQYHNRNSAPKQETPKADTSAVKVATAVSKARARTVKKAEETPAVVFSQN
jgi:hypothetical protein